MTDTDLSPAALADMLVEQLGYQRALAAAEAAVDPKKGPEVTLWADVAALLRLMKVDDETEEQALRRAETEGYEAAMEPIGTCPYTGAMKASWEHGYNAAHGAPD